MELATGRPGVVLRSFTAADAAGFHALLQDSAEHLGLPIPGRPLREMSSIGFGSSLTDPDLGFASYEAETMAGRAALNPVAPPRYGCGYLLAESACGRGLATLPVRRLVMHAGTTLAATDTFAGVTHGNDASVAVMKRVGFIQAASFENYARYHLCLSGYSPSRTDRGDGAVS